MSYTYSNSQLTKAVDATFTTMRQDLGLEPADDLARLSNPLSSDASVVHHAHRLQLRKRKCHYNDRAPVPQIHTDFLSGIFQDLAEVSGSDCEQGGDCGNSVSTTTYPASASPASNSSLYGSCETGSGSGHRPSKKSRLTKSLSRCTKSFAHIQNCVLPDGHPLIDSSSPASASTLLQCPHLNHSSLLDLLSGNSNDLNDDTDTDTRQDPHPVSSDSAAAKMVDHIFSDSLTNIHFPDLPSLPATVSASSCSSNNLNLTQTSVQAAQVLETPPQNETSNCSVLEEVEQDCASASSHGGYGWFVEMDEENVRDRLQTIAAASENCRVIAADPQEKNSLAFAAQKTRTEAKKAAELHLDSEVEWAKAADTVDDVLGGILF